MNADMRTKLEDDSKNIVDMARRYPEGAQPQTARDAAVAIGRLARRHGYTVEGLDDKTARDVRIDLGRDASGERFGLAVPKTSFSSQCLDICAYKGDRFRPVGLVSLQQDIDGVVDDLAREASRVEMGAIAEHYDDCHKFDYKNGLTSPLLIDHQELPIDYIERPHACRDALDRMIDLEPPTVEGTKLDARHPRPWSYENLPRIYGSYATRCLLDDKRLEDRRRLLAEDGGPFARDLAIKCVGEGAQDSRVVISLQSSDEKTVTAILSREAAEEVEQAVLGAISKYRYNWDLYGKTPPMPQTPSLSAEKLRAWESEALDNGFHENGDNESSVDVASTGTGGALLRLTDENGAMATVELGQSEAIELTNRIEREAGRIAARQRIAERKRVEEQRKIEQRRRADARDFYDAGYMGRDHHLDLDGICESMGLDESYRLADIEGIWLNSGASDAVPDYEDSWTMRMATNPYNE